jgi:hypothetical protein
MCRIATRSRKVEDVSDAAAVDVYECSGLRVASEIPLSAPRAEGESSVVDVTIELGDECDPPFERPSVDVVAEFVRDDFPWYTFSRVEGGFVGRMPGIADFAISGDLTRVVVHPVTGGRTNVISIVLPGTVVAFLLSMGGQCVLHGSAVDIGGEALAFVGVSGQGKSTMAAMFCAAGAALVTDDVLPLEFDSAGPGRGSVRCRRAGHEIRLREKAASLADRFGTAAGVRVTEDDRRAVSPSTSGLALLAMRAIVLPRPDREHDTVSVRLLGAGEAALALGRCQRIEGWRGPAELRRQFEDTFRVAESVPVFEVAVPWGPPFAADLPEQVLAACGMPGLAESLVPLFPASPDGDAR